MKYDFYIYEENGVKLDFKFPIGPESITQKLLFLALLKKAAADLEKELAIAKVKERA